MINAMRLMRCVFLALAIMVAAPLAGAGGMLLGATEAVAQTVNRISISGNNRVDNATITQRLAVGVGGQATGAALSASTVALESTGLFSTVSVTYSGGTLNVRVAENPIIASVLFEGNQRFSDEQLLAMVGVAGRGSFTEAGLRQDVANIEAAYVNDGFKGVTVSTRVEPIQGRMRVVFVVNEGQRSGIAAINFTGNNSIGAGTLKGILRTKESHLLSFLFRDDVYNEDLLLVDAEAIRIYYANHGFPDAQVTHVAEYDPGRNGYFVSFTVIEGERYEFGSVGVETSIAGIDPGSLRWTIRTSEGQRYALNDLQRTVEDMAFEATAQGYSFADVRPRITRDVANRRFNIDYLVDEGARIYVERIDILGNEKTRDFVIRRELDFAEGDPFNRSLLQRGESNINRLGFFETVRVGVSQGSAPDKVLVTITVVEKSTGDYGATAGWSSTDGLLGEISLTERNFLGRGQYLRIAVGASQAGRTFDLSFTEPRFMGLRIASGIDVYHRVIGETTTNYYGTTATGGQLRFTAPVTRDLSATILGGFERNVIEDKATWDDDGDPNTPEVAFGGPLSQVVTNGQTFNKAWVGYTLTYNTLDDQQRPTEGIIASLTQQYVGIDHNYIRTDARARYFMPLLDDWGVVASVKGQAGIINDLSGNGVHPVEAIYIGQNIVRGFDPRGIGPRLASGEPNGSTMYAAASVELDFPLPIIPESLGVRGAVWADAAYISGVGGNLAADPASVSTPLKATVGASVIWHSPFGPLRGDFGYVLSKGPTDRSLEVCGSQACPTFQFSIQTLL